MGDLAHAHEHGVDPGPLERQHFLAALDVDPGDRELPGRDVGQQLEDGVERVVVVVPSSRREQEDLRIALLERELQLLLVADVGDRLEVRDACDRPRAGA